MLRAHLTRRGAVLGGLLSGLLALFAVLAGPAWAHATLIGTSPPAGYAVPRPPTTVSLSFDEPVTTGRHALVVTGPGGTAVSTGPLQHADGGRRISVTVDTRLPAGGYTVTWQVTATDGDVVGGSYGFAVGSGHVPATRSAQTRGLVAAAVLRWLLFTGLALALGGLFADQLARRRASGTELILPRPLLRAGAVLVLVATAGLAVHLLGGGSLLTGVGRFSVAALAGSPPGRLALIELLAAAAALAAALSPRPRLIGLPLLVIVAVEGVRAHPEAAAPGWGLLITMVHLCAAALWVGALVHVLRVAKRWGAGSEVTRALLGDYARWALWLFVAVVISGIAAAVVLFPTLEDVVRTGYGQVLLVKMLAVGVVAGLALLARLRLRHAAARDPADDRTRGLGGAVRGERTVLLGVLALTAVLVSLAPPTPATPAVPGPPPAPSGPVVPLAALVGQLTVDVTASAGNLLVTVAAPEIGPAPRYRLSGSLTAAGHRQLLRMRGCGSGCFTAPVAWPVGQSALRLDVRAPGWTGGQTLLTVPWPPQPDAAILPKVLAAMRAAGPIVVHEVDTSNTTGPSFPITVRLSGAQFLTSEPYGASGAGGVVVLARAASLTEIAFAFTPQNYYFRLWLDSADRIVREVIVSPNHLITRTFGYG